MVNIECIIVFPLSRWCQWRIRDLATCSTSYPENGNKGVSTPSLWTPHTQILSCTHNLYNQNGWYSIMHHSRHPNLQFYSNRILILGPTLPLSLLGLHGLTQYMDDDSEDMSHANIGHGTLSNYEYSSALVRNVKWGPRVLWTNWKCP